MKQACETSLERYDSLRESPCWQWPMTESHLQELCVVHLYSVSVSPETKRSIVPFLHVSQLSARLQLRVPFRCRWQKPSLAKRFGKCWRSWISQEMSRNVRSRSVLKGWTIRFQCRGPRCPLVVDVSQALVEVPGHLKPKLDRSGKETWNCVGKLEKKHKSAKSKKHKSKIKGEKQGAKKGKLKRAKTWEKNGLVRLHLFCFLDLLLFCIYFAVCLEKNM